MVLLVQNPAVYSVTLYFLRLSIHVDNGSGSVVIKAFALHAEL